MTQVKVQILCEGKWAGHFRTGIGVWRLIWKTSIGPSPRRNLPIDIRIEVDEKNFDLRSASWPDVIVIYHHFAWENLGARASEHGAKVIVYGVMGHDDEAKRWLRVFGSKALVLLDEPILGFFRFRPFGPFLELLFDAGNRPRTRQHFDKVDHVALR